MIFVPFLWFIVITAAVVWALPRVLDAILYYMDRRARLWTQEVELEERKLEIIKEQVKLQQMVGRRPSQINVREGAK